MPSTQHLTREQIAGIVGNNPRAVKLFELLLADVSTNIPVAVDETKASVTAGQLGVFGDRPRASSDIRAAGGLVVARDAAGYVVSVDFGSVVDALAPYLRRPDQSLDVRQGSGVSVSRDAAGFVVANVADDASSIIANKVFSR